MQQAKRDMDNAQIKVNDALKEIQDKNKCEAEEEIIYQNCLAENEWRRKEGIMTTFCIKSKCGFGLFSPESRYDSSQSELKLAQNSYNNIFSELQGSSINCE